MAGLEAGEPGAARRIINLILVTALRTSGSHSRMKRTILRWFSFERVERYAARNATIFTGCLVELGRCQNNAR
jgi:hypothetical protein